MPFNAVNIILDVIFSIELPGRSVLQTATRSSQQCVASRPTSFTSQR
jgi:hypothetical protein